MKDNVAVYVRLRSEQHEWLLWHCFQTRLSQAEVIRRALDLYRVQEEEKMMDIVIIEAGLDYMDQLEVIKNAAETVSEAIKIVEAKGYSVIPNEHGGQNEVADDGTQDYVAITVYPEDYKSFSEEEAEEAIERGDTIYLVQVAKGTEDFYDETSEPRTLLRTPSKEYALAFYKTLPEVVELDEPETDLDGNQKFESPVVVETCAYGSTLIRG